MAVRHSFGISLGDLIYLKRGKKREEIKALKKHWQTMETWKETIRKYRGKGKQAQAFDERIKKMLDEQRIKYYEEVYGLKRIDRSRVD